MHLQDECGEAVKKVLIVSPFFPPFPKVGATKRIESFVRYLPANRWKPIVLSMNWGKSDFLKESDKAFCLTRNLAYASWKEDILNLVEI